MQKYYENLDDYNDHSPSILMEAVKWIMPVIIFTASIILMFAVCGSLEVM